MINPFHKIAISMYINNNDDKVKYSFRPNLLTGLHEAYINYKGFVSVQMLKDKEGNTHYCLEYCLNNDDENTIVQTEEQNFFDKIFIQRMYSKMLRFYQHHNKRQH